MPIDNNPLFGLRGIGGPRGNPGPSPVANGKLYYPLPSNEYYVYEYVGSGNYYAVRMGFCDYEDTFIHITTVFQQPLELGRMYVLSDIRQYPSSTYPVAVKYEEITYRPRTKPRKTPTEIAHELDKIFRYGLVLGIGFISIFASFRAVMVSDASVEPEWRPPPPSYTHDNYQETIERREAARRYLRSIGIER